MNEELNLSFDLPVDDFTRAGEASSTVKHTLKKIGLNPEIIRRISIALYEGEINIFIHAKKGSIDVTIAKDKVDMVLNDEGPGISDINQAMQEGFSTAPQHVRNLGFGAGMGLPNMKKNTDEMRIESIPGEKTTIYMTVYLNNAIH